MNVGYTRRALIRFLERKSYLLRKFIDFVKGQQFKLLFLQAMISNIYCCCFSFQILAYTGNNHRIFVWL